MAVVLPAEELLAMVNCPVKLDAVVGSKTTFTTVLWPAFKVSGRDGPAKVNAAPLKAIALMVTGAAPLELNVTDCVDGVLIATPPNAMLVVLTPREAATALSCSAMDEEELPAVAVSCAVWLVATAEAAAVKATDLAPAGTETDAGTATALLLLLKFAESPLLGAAAFKFKVQLSDAAPVMDVVAHVMRLIEVVVPE